MNDLKKLRKAAGYDSQEAAARRFDVSVRQWGAWEREELNDKGNPVRAPTAVIDLLEIEADRNTEGQTNG